MNSNVGKLLSTAVVAAAVGAVATHYLSGNPTETAPSVSTKETTQAEPVKETQATGTTLANVKAKGFIQCGVSQGVPGFSSADDKGKWTGIDVDACRAVSAAIFGDPDKVKYTPLSAKERFTALQSGEIDILSRNTTWTLTRDTSLGIDFTMTNFYDGQGFMVRKDLGVTSALELDGTTVCTQQGTTTELNMADFFRKNKLSYVPVVIDNINETFSAFLSGRCDVFTTDKSGLAAKRSEVSNQSDYVILPETISKEPLGPAVRHGDNQWKDLVTWSLFAQVNAEEMGIDSKNIDKIKSESTDPAVKRLLGTEGDLGKDMGVSSDWAYNIIKLVGNYGEVFDRNLGPDTPVNIPRGLNKLWTEGGIMYAPPVR